MPGVDTGSATALVVAWVSHRPSKCLEPQPRLCGPLPGLGCPPNPTPVILTLGAVRDHPSYQEGLCP